ncbi:hypothetical protein [Aminobacter carboxidus]|uniref:Uncharacterized protein n=1 Tax=Aminobacter carboxidus TaxID=376165 RepID=A0ABR9GXM8_9HYPH|nr:hypothetical protein [Aminobacter carboxidus]MBE1208441.1 hypothetical protein [Aminobacter carboxidus]
MAKFFVDETCRYIGAFDGVWVQDSSDEDGNLPPKRWDFPALPAGAIEVPMAPEHGGQVWDSVSKRWGAIPAPLVVLYPVDLWSRMTDTEAEQVEAAMAGQTVRLQNVFRSASSYRSDHELWPLLETMATELFGESRATEVLAPSVG